MSKTNIEPINKNKSLVEAKIKSFIKNGRKEITTLDQLHKFPIGSLLSYSNKNGIFRSAGVLWKIGDNYFVYLNLDNDKKYKVRMKNVDKIWCGCVYDVKRDIISLVGSTGKKTNKPVIIGDVVIYYAKDNFDYERFVCTGKYKLHVKWYEMFGDA